MTNEQIARYFHSTQARIYSNTRLRDPQRDAYKAIHDHFKESNEPCYVELPMGCGKSGVIGITPFGLTQGRVLILVPNLTIRNRIFDELDISKIDSFYTKIGILKQPLIDGPFLTELKSSANIHDCDNAHMVVANAQQFSRMNNKWYEQLPSDYFQLILVDEAHHNPAATWQRLLDYFKDAKVVGYTATPFRSDGQPMTGRRVYSYSYSLSMINGYISFLSAVHVKPDEITFTVEGKQCNWTLDEVLKMREQDWFSKGIALAEECNRNIVQASIQQLIKVKQHAGPRQIIAAACSIRHARQVAALYQEYGLRAEVISSEDNRAECQRIETELRNGLIDVIVQVQMLGEGYDLHTLSVAAVFRPYRSLSPYIQFIGRILRLADPVNPHSPGNKVYVVSHIGLNDERWWSDFTNYNSEDQEFFKEHLGRGQVVSSDQIEKEENATGHMTLRSYMHVKDEKVEWYKLMEFLNGGEIAEYLDYLEEGRRRGLNLDHFGLTEEVLRRNLELAGLREKEIKALSLPVQPQKRRESRRSLLPQEAKSIADVVCNRLSLKHKSKDLLRHFPGKGSSNSVILITLAQALQNKRMNVDSGNRASASTEQLVDGLDASPEIVDSLTALVKSRLEDVKCQR